VEDYYRDNFSDRFSYHNFQHTESVVAQTQLIAEECGIDPSQKSLLTIAALFHDIGYSQNPEKHEEIGANMSEEYLISVDDDQERIDHVKSLILATYYPHSPTNRLEEIIRDADLAYLGTSDFWVGSDSLRAEWENVKGLKYSDKEWLKINAAFLLAHKFYTPCAQKRLDQGKKKNLNQVLKRLSQADKDR